MRTILRMAVVAIFMLGEPGSICVADEAYPPSKQRTTILRIIDGDTLIANLNNTPNRTCPPACASLQRVRLANIDAPELAQPHGPASRDFLASLTTNRAITIHSRGRDRYNRTLAALFSGDTNINLAMVRAGHAWRYRYARKTGPIAEAESLARAEGRGLWATDVAVAPWEFRRRGKMKRLADQMGAYSAATKCRGYSLPTANQHGVAEVWCRGLRVSPTTYSALCRGTTSSSFPKAPIRDTTISSSLPSTPPPEPKT